MVGPESERHGLHHPVVVHRHLCESLPHATGRDARDAFLVASRLVHPDVCADGRAGAAFAALVEAYDAFAPSDVKYDISQAEFQGDALTTAAWMWDDAAAAARRHKARHTLDE